MIGPAAQRSGPGPHGDAGAWPGTGRDEPIADPRRRQQATAYARVRRRLMLIELLAGAGALIAVLVTGLAVAWRVALEALLQPLAPASSWAGHLALVAAYVATLGGAGMLLMLPFGYYGGFVLPHRFGLSTQTVRGWVADAAKGLLLGVMQAVLVALPVAALLRLTPHSWWLWAGVVLALFGVVLTNLAPVLLVPLFFKLRPLPDGDLRGRLERLARAANTAIRGVFVIDLSRRTRAANAAVMGLGNTRRIVLGDTLLSSFGPDEVVAVMAHELGHQVARDLWRSIALDSVLTLVALWLCDRLGRLIAPALGMDGLADVAALPLLLLIGSALFLVALPVTAGFSRRREAAADAFAVRITGDPEAWKGALRRLAETNLAEVDPPAWFEWLVYTHPSIRHRLEAADRVRP
jgi:STE24 endopeptidase